MAFQESISKEAIKALPLLTFQGNIHLVTSDAQVNMIAKKLKTSAVLGFDTEKKPTFQKGVYHHTALLQLSTAEDAYLFRINKIGLPAAVIDLLEDEQIAKVGVGIRDDLEDLKKVRLFEPGGFVELIDITKDLGIKNAGVRNLAGIFLEKRVSKNQQTSNWENETLTKAQQLYAAADAWIPLRIYQLLDQKGFLYDQ